MADFSKHTTLGLIASGIALGIFLNWELQINPYSIITMGLISLIGYWYSKYNLSSILLLFCTAVAIGSFRISFYQDQAAPPNEGLLNIQKHLSSTDYYDSYTAKIISSDQSPKPLILLKFKKSDSVQLLPSDQIYHKSTPTLLNYPSDPWSFSYKNYLNKMGIKYELINPSYQQLEATNSIQRAAYLIQNHIGSHIKKQLHQNREQTTALALLVGIKDVGFKVLQKSYSKAGVSHLLALSGMHTAIVFSFIWILLWPVGFLPKGKSIRWSLAILLVWCFALISGWSHSVIRACILMSSLGLSKLLRRPNATVHFLLLAFIINIIADPLALFQVGFQMSYLAVLAIITLYPILKTFLRHSNKIIDKLFDYIALSTAAQLGVFPLSLFYFGSLPLHFLVANITIVPLMGMIIYTGLISLVVPMGFQLLEPLLYQLNQIVATLALDEFNFNSKIDRIQLLLIYSILISALIACKIKSYKLMCISLIFGLFTQLYSISKAHKKQQLESFILIGGFKSPQLHYKKGTHLLTYSATTVQEQTLKGLMSYFNTNTHIYHKPAKAYNINGIRLIHIDSRVSYSKIPPTDLLLISNNPPLHFGRLIDSLQPRLIFIDKSNYPQNLQRWKTTARNKKIPLMDLSEGSYNYNF